MRYTDQQLTYWYGCPSEDGRHRILYVEKNMGLCLSSNLAICKHCHI